jgi:two-component system chemotaxis response regulator CheY
MIHPEMAVLVVDEASTMRGIVRGLLKEPGFRNIREAQNGQAALDELRKHKADLSFRREHAGDDRHRPPARDPRR